MAKAQQASNAEAETENQGVAFGEGDNVGNDLTVDFSGVEDTGFEVMPRGVYNCVVEELEFGFSQASNNPMWSWRLEVEDGEYQGRKLFFHSVFTEKALPMVKKTLAAVAPELLDEPLKPTEVADNGTLVGRRLRARVDIRTYEGQKRNNVRQILPPTEGGDAGFLS